MFSPSILVGCLPLQKLSRLIKRHCFRGRPTHAYKMKGWESMIEELLWEPWKKGFSGLLQNSWGSLEKWSKGCRQEGLWKQKPGGEVVCVALYLAQGGRARTENTNFKKNCWSHAAKLREAGRGQANTELPDKCVGREMKNTVPFLGNLFFPARADTTLCE